MEERFFKKLFISSEERMRRMRGLYFIVLFTLSVTFSSHRHQGTCIARLLSSRTFRSRKTSWTTPRQDFHSFSFSLRCFLCPVPQDYLRQILVRVVSPSLLIKRAKKMLEGQVEEERERMEVEGSEEGLTSDLCNLSCLPSSVPKRIRKVREKLMWR